MITNYNLGDNKLVAVDTDGVFTIVNKPSREEIGQLSAAYDFPFDYIGGILDDDENARFEIDQNHNMLLLLQYPATETDTTEVYLF